MSQADQLFKTIFAWHSLSDACPKCQALNGHEFEGQSLYQEVVWDPIWGNVWDLKAGHSLAHPNCRCQLEVRLEMADADYVKQLLRQLLESLEGLEQDLEKTGLTQMG